MILASYIRPFDAKQKIYVLDEKKNTEEIRLADLSNYADEVMQLITEYNIDTLELHGPIDVCQKTRERIVAKETSKFSNNRLKIVYVKGE